MDPHSFIARAEAQRWLGIAEKLLISHDLVGSKTFAIRARESDPRLEPADQILAIADTLLAAEKRVVGNNGSHQPDYYAILQLVRFVQDTEHVASQYRRLAVLLNPHQNRFPYADQAFQLVNDAWAVLSNPMRKSMYDSDLDYPPQQQMTNLGFNLEQQQQQQQQQQQHHQQQHHQQQQQPHNFFSISQDLPEQPQGFQSRIHHQQQQQQQLQQHNFLSQPNPVRPLPVREQEHMFQHREQDHLFQTQVQPFQVTSPPHQQSRPSPQPHIQSPPATPQSPFSWQQGGQQSQSQFQHHQMKQEHHQHQIKQEQHHQHEQQLQQQLKQEQLKQQQQQQEQLKQLKQQQFLQQQKIMQEEQRKQQQMQEEQRKQQQMQEEQRKQQQLLEEQQRKQQQLLEEQRKQQQLQEEQRKQQQLLEEQRKQQQLLEEQRKQQQLLEEQRKQQQLQEEQQKLLEEQRKQQQLIEEQRKQQQLLEEQQRQQQLQEEQRKQQQLQEEQRKQESLKQNAAPVQNNTNNGVRDEETETELEPEPEPEPDDDSPTFWTACPYCFYMYEYPKLYVECTLRCDHCKRAFQAVRIASPPPIIEGQDAYFYCWGFFPLGLSMSHLQNNKGTPSSNWTPFSSLHTTNNKQNHLNEQAAPKQNPFVNKSSGPRIYIDDITDDVFIGGVSEPSSDSDIEWKSVKKQKLKKMDKGFKERIQVLALRAMYNTVNASVNNVKDGVEVPTVLVVETNKKHVGGNLRKQSKLDLNVAAGTRVREQGEEDNVEGIEFFEGLDDYLSNLPILSVVNDDKVTVA